jgi:hypothetical protein
LTIGQIDPAQKNRRAMEYKNMTSLTREEITRRAARFGNPILAALQRPETNVEQLPTTYFANGGIYRVSTRPPDRPRVYALGFWGTDGIVVLNNEPEHFFELASNSGLSFRSSGDYAAYVTASAPVWPCWLWRWWLPSPSTEEARKKDEVIAKYANIVEGPKMKVGSQSTVTVFVIRDRALLRVNAEVETNGRIRFSEEVMEPEMPTVMLR